MGQHTAGGDGGQLGLGAVTAGDQDNRDLGTQDDACVFGAAKERGGLANAIAHLIVGYQQDVGIAGAGAEKCLCWQASLLTARSKATGPQTSILYLAQRSVILLRASASTVDCTLGFTCSAPQMQAALICS